jgi:formylglycine-generating enzyme
VNVEQTLLRAIQASPDDRLAWLALADGLEEQSDARGELLRVLLELLEGLAMPDRPARERHLQGLLAAGVRPCLPALTNALGQTLTLVPPGKFLMGSPGDEVERFDDEGPQHEVEITRPFYLATHLVTQAEYAALMGVNPSHFGPKGAGSVLGLDTSHLPVENITWHEAVEFCARLSAVPAEQRAGRSYRLPTEAEWEYAYRAGTCTPFFQGASLSSAQANFIGDYPYGGAPKGPNLRRTCDVGSYPPNAFGLFDMAGNVWEWCQDLYASPYPPGPARDPTGPARGSQRVQRGGGWDSSSVSLRAARRAAAPMTGHYLSVGFRVALGGLPHRPA